MALCKPRFMIFPYNLSIFGLNRYAPIEVCVSVYVGGLLLIFPPGSAGWNLRYKNRFFHFPLCLKQLQLLGFSSVIYKAYLCRGLCLMMERPKAENEMLYSVSKCLCMPREVQQKNQGGPH